MIQSPNTPNSSKSSKMEVSESDRISQLPESILQHILSFVPINQAVQTSILSRRWQNLWSSMPDLHFNFAPSVIHSGVDLRNWTARQDFGHRFRHFVSDFLSRRDHTSTIREFHLIFDTTVERQPSPFLQRCVDYAIDHGIETLHIHARCFPPLRLPHSFLDLKGLREIELRHFGYGVYLQENVLLPHLKILCLENSFLSNNGGDLKEPFSRYPELEKLSLHHCKIGGLVIIGPKLRVLEIIDRSMCSNRMEKIWTPRLTLFRYEAVLPFECSNVDFSMLEEIYLNILTEHRFNGKWKTLRWVQMLQHLRNAAIVTLTLDVIKVLQMDRILIEQSPSPFPNLKCLRLRKWCREIPVIQQKVMDYLRGSLCGESLMVEFPEGVSVVEEDCFDVDIDELGLERLFVW